MEILHTTSPPLLLVMALCCDGLIGDPPFIWNRIPHPICLMGTTLTFLEKRLLCTHHTAWRKKLQGVVLVLLLMFLWGGISLLIDTALLKPEESVFSLKGALYGIFVSVFLAQKSLAQHVGAVAHAFETGGLPEAQRSVGQIVGRRTEELDTAGVCRAAIESCAENFSDGVVAPVFWTLIFGLPGLVIYKMVNTADSMIGHRSARYREFGWAAARFDDLLNWIPARLSVLFLVGATWIRRGYASGRASWHCAWREGVRHCSPNAGWPEAAMAGALGLALGGPRSYAGVDSKKSSEAWLNPSGRSAAIPSDIDQALSLYITACVLQGGTLLGLSLLLT